MSCQATFNAKHETNREMNRRAARGGGGRKPSSPGESIVVFCPECPVIYSMGQYGPKIGIDHGQRRGRCKLGHVFTIKWIKR
jgi:hypothetical protein